MHFEYKDIEKYGHKSQYLGDMFNTMYIRLQIMAQFFFDVDIKKCCHAYTFSSTYKLLATL